MRACMIFNPSARGEKAKLFLRHLEELRHACCIRPTPGPGTAQSMAAAAVREGFDTVIAAGGDGTVNEVLNGIASVPEGLTNVRLGILPLGTVNVFARELGLPLSLKGAWSALSSEKEISIDLPKAEFAAAGKPQHRFFAQMAGAGLDSRAIELVDWELKKRIGQFAYMVAGFKALREKPKALLVSNGKQTAAGELVVVGNGRYYAGQFPLLRNADLRDGILDVCVFPKVSWLVLARYACAFVSRRILFPGCEIHLQGARISLESASPTSFALEGENAGMLPAVFTVQPRALRVCVP